MNNQKENLWKWSEDDHKGPANNIKVAKECIEV